jgi:hypothetical protein
MIVEKIILNRDACFIDKDANEVTLKKGTHLSFIEEQKFASCKKIIVYIDDSGNRYISNDAEFPSLLTGYVIVVKDGLFYEVTPFGTHIRTAILPVGTKLKIDNNLLFMDNHFYTTDNLSCLENVYEFPKIKVKADAEKRPKFELDEKKKYAGQEGIDVAILFLQTTDLSKHIVRDDNKDLFVDLGSSNMWPDIDNAQWIMKLNSLIPIASAVSVGKRILKGEPRLAIGLHSNFI